MEKLLPFELVKLGCNPDGNFPQGVPNPLLPENQAVTAEAVKKHGADFGVAWDGDFDRCFIYDDKGRFIDACYMVGFLAESFLKRELGVGIIYDSRTVWNVEDIVKSHGGTPIICRGGHVFFKDKMRKTKAVYGGEMSAHNYFRDFYCCDSGMIPWLLIGEMLSKSGARMSSLLESRIKKYPVSGEVNIEVADCNEAVCKVEKKFVKKGKIEKLDGISVEFDDWRFNLRGSNTENLLRLNVESKNDKSLCQKGVEKIKDIIVNNI